MITKITGLTGSNVRALREECSHLLTDITATTATFVDDPQTAYRRMEGVMIRIGPMKGHPRASLHAVMRKLHHLAYPLGGDAA